MLGPLLFLVYVNDLPRNVQCDLTCLYADDTTLLAKGNMHEDLTEKSELALMEADEWFKSNGLTLNKNKTQKLILTTKVLAEPKTICFLGLHISNNLSYKAHVDYTTKALSSAIYAVRRTMEVATYEAARTAYFSLFQSRATYGILLWGHSPEAIRVFLKQKEVVRILSSVDHRTSCRTLFKRHGILTLPCLYILTCVLYVHSNRSKYVVHSDIHHHNTRHKSDLIPPSHRIKKSQMSTNYLAVKIYNHLPNSIRMQDERRLKMTVKRLLLDHECYSLDEYFSIRF